MNSWPRLSSGKVKWIRLARPWPLPSPARRVASRWPGWLNPSETDRLPTEVVPDADRSVKVEFGVRCQIQDGYDFQEELDWSIVQRFSDSERETGAQHCILAENDAAPESEIERNTAIPTASPNTLMNAYPGCFRRERRAIWR